MKMVSNILENVEGLQILNILGLLIFVTLFIIILYRTIRRPNKEMSDIKNSILSDDNSDEIITS